MSARAAFANTLWAASNLPAWRKFKRALRDPARAQAEVLRAILTRAADSQFGRQHRFAEIRTCKEFRDRVPLADYADLEPWIEKIRRGEPRVLTGEPVKRLAVTSGSSGARKLIPYTGSLQAEFNRAIGPWMVDLFRSQPALLGGSAYWSISPAAREPDQDSAVPIGFEDDSEYLGGFRRKLVDAVMAVPSTVQHARDIDDWRRQTIAHLSARRDLRLISVWHPSFLSLLLDRLPQPPQILWPKLRIVSCWTDGHADLSARALAERLSGVIIQPKGLIATEGIVSIPFAGGWPLAIRSHVFEFLTSDGQSLLAHELRQDQTYEVCLTTSGGLYRYRLHDQIRVEGFVDQTPSIRFLGKSGQISDLRGEKLSEAFVGRCLRSISSSAWRFAMLAPEGSGYTAFIEGDVQANWADELDQQLRANPHYAYCRDLGQLARPRVFCITTGAAATYAARMSASQKLGDIKPMALSKLADWPSHFVGGYVDRPEVNTIKSSHPVA